MVEALRRAIKSRQSNNLLEGVKVTTNYVVTHQQFANDNLLPGATKVKEATQLKMLLESFGKASGQISNKEKLKVFFFSTPSPYKLRS